MRFLVDNQLPASLARWLRDRGHDAEHVFELGLHLFDDRALWAWALADTRIVISKDEDFLYLASQQNDAGRLLWVRFLVPSRRVHHLVLGSSRGGITVRRAVSP